MLSFYLLPFFIIAVPASAAAASFDCSAAKAPREKLICSDKALSELDDQIGRVYQEKKALLSPRGAKLLQSSEQSWLHYITIVCPERKPNAQEETTQAQCLQQEYRQRLDALSRVGEKIGPFVFNRIDLFSARPFKDDSGKKRGFLVQQVSFPQIDNMDTPVAETWNKQAERSLPAEDCDNCDASLEYMIGYATAKFISMSWTSSFYGHGAAHGLWGVTNDNFILEPTPRTVQLADVFKEDTNVSKKLEKLFFDALREQAEFTVDDADDRIKSEMRAIIANAGRWFFTNEGLEIRFTAYEGGCYACTPDPVTIRWADLKPLLATNAVIP